MADGRKNNGGKRQGAGRPTKADELLLIEKLSPLDDLAFKELEKGVKAGDFSFIKMFFEYRFGKPAEKVKLDANIEQQITGFTVEIVTNEQST
jgi:hypothetical protein